MKVKGFSAQNLFQRPSAGTVLFLAVSVVLPVNAESLAPVVEATSIQARQSNLIEERLNKLERLLDSQVLMNFSLRLDELENQLQQLQGDTELQIHNQEGMKRRQQALYLDLDQRLEVLETGVKADQAESVDLSIEPPAEDSEPILAVFDDERIPDATLITAEGSSVVGSSSSGDPAPDYSEAYSLLKNGQYDEAINAFQSFLKNHSETEYADNAQYWLAEANYVTRRFSQAVREFGLVISDYSNSQKVPGALLKVGYAHYELEEWPQARTFLEKLVTQFPESSAARLAENRLKRMEEEGR
ncbi:MAG: tol-pal system protein YbgF [Gammaproteobacteria bacterium]|nr:tol-pal system protein YbgF [Gammaproteobacteria bacterium]